jgi:hypothetical protein
MIVRQSGVIIGKIAEYFFKLIIDTRETRELAAYTISSSGMRVFGTTEQAAEKLEYLRNGKGKHTSGAEAQVISLALSARVNSCPDTLRANRSFSASWL